MDYEVIKLSKEGRIATIMVDRPDALNALSVQVIGELEHAFHDVGNDDNIGVLIFTGEGKAFIAGADISELHKLDAVSGLETVRRGQRVLRFLETMGKPSIAAINGFALGGGCELAMACTIRIASDKAKLGQPEVNLGVIPGYAGTQRLARIVGKGVALDLVLTGRMIDAEEALRIGLVTQVVAADELPAVAKATAKTLLGKGPIALKAAMEVIDRGYDVPFEEACLLEAMEFAVLCGTEDSKEGLGAFLEKRKPDFKGK